MDVGPRVVGAPGCAVSSAIVVVCEAGFDFKIARTLCDRIAQECGRSLHWPMPMPQDEYIRWGSVPKLMTRLRIKATYGHFKGSPGQADAKAGRNALQIVRALAKADLKVELVVLQRDADNQPERALGLRQAAEAVPAHFAVVVGVADPMVEAWVLAGFDPATPAEHERLNVERVKLGFDPRSDAARLQSKDVHAARSAKRVLSTLTDGDHGRQSACVESTPLTRLRERGADSGLKDFLASLERALM